MKNIFQGSNLCRKHLKRKGLIELIDIFERLELDEYILRIIGDGPLLKELKNQDFKKTIKRVLRQ